VFGLSDGLVTNISLVLGVAGASPGGQIVRLVGVAGLVAGAFSMAAGEYLSMAAQRELMERELEVEREALTLSPEGEAQELRGMYEERGIAPAVARDMVHEVMQDPELALETHAREELGISPKHLGSPVQAALSSFFAFGLGAFIPLVPWLFSRGNGAILASVLLSAVAAVTIGIVLALFTRRSMFRSALRQLALTAVAAAVTYAIGRALGTGIS
jgi:VIT1/CCC1 family predicted Fe2+/Mn2+ transporter